MSDSTHGIYFLSADDPYAHLSLPIDGDGCLDLRIIFTTIHIIYIVREFEVSCGNVRRSLSFVS